jgi:TRAP-type C4-dicarboxylate transport system permease small subunit
LEHVPTLERLALGISRLLAVFGLAVLLAFAAATLLDGLLRGLMDRPIEWVRDLGGLMVAVSVACCFPWGFVTRHNITIKAIDLGLGRKGRQVLNFAAALVVMIILIGISVEFWSYSGKVARAGETTIMLNVPTAPVWYAIDGIFWFCVLVQTIVAAVEGVRLFAAFPERQQH